MRRRELDQFHNLNETKLMFYRTEDNFSDYPNENRFSTGLHSLAAITINRNSPKIFYRQ